MKLADLKNSGFGRNSILGFCRKYIRYISAGVIVVILIIVLAVTTVNNDKENDESKAGNDASLVQEEIFAVDAVPEINTLIENYYAAYAAGDFETLAACATPVSDIEKSYIAVVNEYISGYDNIRCYTKNGLKVDEYVVSVVVDIQFIGIEQTAPGVDFFYVRKNEEGSYYIDNLYSSRFNLAFRELELDSQIEAFIAEYEAQDDVVQLLADVQDKCDEVLSANEELNTANNNLVQAVQTWVAELVGSDENIQAAEGEQNTEAAVTPEEQGEPEAAVTPEEQGEPEATVTPEEQTEPEQTQTASQEETTNSLQYVPEGTIITANQAYNVRESMGEDAERIGTVDPGDKIEVVLSYEEGWTKVKWNDKIGYIKTDLLLNN